MPLTETTHHAPRLLFKLRKEHITMNFKYVITHIYSYSTKASNIYSDNCVFNMDKLWIKGVIESSFFCLRNKLTMHYVRLDLITLYRPKLR